MKRLGILAVLLLAACSHSAESEGKTEEITILQKTTELRLSEGHGAIRLSFKSSNAVSISVMAENLDPNSTYSITITGDEGGGVSFGPRENVTIHKGEIIGETTFQPDDKGNLTVEMLNPERVFQGSDKMRVAIYSKDKVKRIQSAPFKLNQ
ncbi:hypothetical protein JOC86_004661 [Bacillus pakistanensis]|uniref:Lipoprotein n=1 Tax=Rossellomorea pakistanensis TaxID=992288 RepID=A0ABS2NKM4_9BACI|nr:hypothetical protein [Bacillus pakistanensis]MBM7588086.1 hypothetical protein [Bacillus pakistanensis]